MDKALKQRMVGAVVLIALGVIFIPMLLDGGSEQDSRTVELDIPAPPDREYRSRLLPLDEQAQDEASQAAGQEPAGQVRRPAEDASPGPGANQPTAPEPVKEQTQDPAGPATADTGGAREDDAGGEAATGSDSGAGETPAQPAQEPSAQTGSAQPERRQPLGNWFVQVGSFSQESNARELRDRLRDAGYTAFVETSTVEGRTTHRVKVGPEMDRARAERSRDEIRSEFDLEGIVVSEP